MSLSSLPEELLHKISLDLQKSSQEQSNPYAWSSLTMGGTDCGNHLLKPLASVSAQLRAVVAPLLFSQVVVTGRPADTSPRVQRLQHLLSLRPHIACLCKYVRSYSALDQRALIYYLRELRLTEEYEQFATIIQSETSWSHPLDIILKTLRLLPNVSCLHMPVRLRLHGWFIGGINVLHNLQRITLDIFIFEYIAHYANQNPQSLRKMQCSQLFFRDRIDIQPSERAEMACIAAGMRVKELVLDPTSSISEHLKKQRWAEIENITFSLDDENINKDTFEWLQTYMTTPLGDGIASITFSLKDKLLGFFPVIGAADILPLLATLTPLDESKSSICDYTIVPVLNPAEESAQVPLDSVWRRWKVIKIVAASHSNVRDAMPNWTRQAPYLEVLDLGETNFPEDRVPLPTDEVSNYDFRVFKYSYFSCIHVGCN